MAEQGKYYWIKLKNDFFDIPAINWLADQNNGYAYIVLYQKLCLLTMNNGGELTQKIGEMLIPYDAKKIAKLTQFDFDTVVVALELYRRLGLVYEQENGVLRLDGIENIVGSETKWAEKKRLQRQKKAALSSGNGGQDGTKRGQLEDNVPLVSEDNVREEIRNKRLEIRDKRLEIEKKKTAAELPAPPRQSIPYEAVRESYNEICHSLSKCTKMSEARKKSIKARFSSGYTLEDFKTVFSKAEASGFLKGRNDRNWKASFDWLISDKYMAKVLDGAYDDFQHDQQPTQPQRSSNPFLQMLREEEARNGQK